MPVRAEVLSPSSTAQPPLTRTWRMPEGKLRASQKLSFVRCSPGWATRRGR